MMEQKNEAAQSRPFRSALWRALSIKTFNHQLSERNLCRLVVGVFILLLLPMLIIARYAVPCADDFYYAINAHTAWLETGSVLSVIKAAAETTRTAYFTWQGTFADIFLSIFIPDVFAPHFYYLTAYFLIITSVIN